MFFLTKITKIATIKSIICVITLVNSLPIAASRAINRAISNKPSAPGLSTRPAWINTSSKYKPNMVATNVNQNKSTIPRSKVTQQSTRQKPLQQKKWARTGGGYKALNPGKPLQRRPLMNDRPDIPMAILKISSRARKPMNDTLEIVPLVQPQIQHKSYASLSRSNAMTPEALTPRSTNSPLKNPGKARNQKPANLNLFQPGKPRTKKMLEDKPLTSMPQTDTKINAYQTITSNPANQSWLNKQNANFKSKTPTKPLKPIVTPNNSMEESIVLKKW